MILMSCNITVQKAFRKYYKYLLCNLLQNTNAFPVMCSPQLQIGICLYTSHIAFGAQTPPVQGFMHLLFLHALSCGQSELNTHSGRHSLYGSPL